MNRQQIVEELNKEIGTLEKARELLMAESGMVGYVDPARELAKRRKTVVVGATTEHKKKTMSEATRRKISIAQRRRYREAKAKARQTHKQGKQATPKTAAAAA